MKISDVLAEDTIHLNFKARDKWETIDRLVNGFVTKGKLKMEHKKTVLDALLTRENIASTGMEHGVALPHASVDEIDDALCAFAISPQGVPFQTQDNIPATLIMLLVVPKKKIQVHIKTLAAIAKLLNSKEMRDTLLKSKTAADVMSTLRKEEAKP